MGIVDNLHITHLCDTEHYIASALPEVEAPVTARGGGDAIGVY